jgi:hypothetical protein
MRWRNRDGNHETYDDQILMDLLDLLWWICTAKFWRHNGLAMSCGETLHFFQTCLIFYKLWTPDSQSLTPGLKKTSFAFGYLLFEMPLGRHQDTEFWWVLQKKLENLGFQVGRNSIYIYMWVSSVSNAFGKASKHQVLHRTIENLGWQGWAAIKLFEYSLFKMPLGKHQNTKFCT